MEPAPIVMVMGQGKETRGGEGKERRATSTSAARAVMMGDELGFYLMEESHVDWSSISCSSNRLFPSSCSLEFRSGFHLELVATS